MFFRSVFVAAAVATLGVAEQVSGVFTGIDSLTWVKGYDYGSAAPDHPSWMTKLSWSLDGSKHKPGDTVTLNMPCVYKMTADYPQFDLVADGKTYAQCAFYNGEYSYDFSELKCTVTKNLVDNASATGTVTIPVTFNVGLSGSDIDLKCAKKYHVGHNQIVFNDGGDDIVGDVNFEGGVPQKDRQKVSPALHKNTLLSRFQDGCANGFDNGRIGFKTTTGNIDCSQVTAGFYTSMNAFDAIDEATSEFKHNIECLGQTVYMHFENVPKGYTPYITAMVDGRNVRDAVDFIQYLTCSDDIFKSKIIQGQYNRDVLYRKTFTPYENGGVSGEGKVAYKVGEVHKPEPALEVVPSLTTQASLTETSSTEASSTKVEPSTSSSEVPSTTVEPSSLEVSSLETLSSLSTQDLLTSEEPSSSPEVSSASEPQPTELSSLEIVSEDHNLSTVYETVVNKVTVTKTCEVCEHETVTVQVPCEVSPTNQGGEVVYVTKEKKPQVVTVTCHDTAVCQPTVTHWIVDESPIDQGAIVTTTVEHPAPKSEAAPNKPVETCTNSDECVVSVPTESQEQPVPTQGEEQSVPSQSQEEQSVPSQSQEEQQQQPIPSQSEEQLQSQPQPSEGPHHQHSLENQVQPEQPQQTNNPEEQAPVNQSEAAPEAQPTASTTTHSLAPINVPTTNVQVPTQAPKVLQSQVPAQPSEKPAIAFEGSAAMAVPKLSALAIVAVGLLFI